MKSHLAITTILAFTLILSFAGSVHAEECNIPDYELDSDFHTTYEINITNPIDDVVFIDPFNLTIPENLTNTSDQVADMVDNLTIPDSCDDGQMNLTFTKDGSKVDTIVQGTTSGFKSSPTLVGKTLKIGSGKAENVVPEDIKTSGKTGVTVIHSMVGHYQGKLINRLPSESPGKISAPEVSSNQFIATTMLGAIIMVIASVFSSHMASGEKLPLLIPLYSRISKDEVLDNPTRGDIYRLIALNPGMDLLTIKKSLGLSNGVLAHHVQTLERERYLRSIRDGRYRRFFVSGSKVQTKSTMELLIIREIETTPMINQSQLARNLGISRQALNYHIQKLSRKGIIIIEKRGRETWCRKRDS